MNPAAPDLATQDAATIWRWLAGELVAAVDSARHGFHLLTLATVGGDGQPEARTVVLRGVDAAGRGIRFHADVRSPKVRAIRADPRVALHWYDPTARVQVRIAARATVHHDDAVAAAAWAAAQPMSRACYASPAAPGDPLAAFPTTPRAAIAGHDAGLARFAVVWCRFDAVDLLSLHASGHQRVRLHLDREPVASTIVAP